MSSDSHHVNYVRIWAILCVLLLVSIFGPMIGIRWITLVTAFGIALVKAYMVAKNFMHVNVQPRYVVYLLSTCLAFMLLFFSAVSPDVMKSTGSGWEKPRWVAEAAEAKEKARLREQGIVPEHGEAHH